MSGKSEKKIPIDKFIQNEFRPTLTLDNLFSCHKKEVVKIWKLALLVDSGSDKGKKK